MNGIRCPVCQHALSLRLARGRKSNKPFLMLVCGQDGRHFRGFINDREFVARALDGIEVPDRNGGAGR